MLKGAVEQGADAVYIGFKDDTNARHFAGLNFNDGTAQKAIGYAQARGVKVYVAINTFAQQGEVAKWRAAVDASARLGVDAIICADIATLAYARDSYPDLPRHLSVQASATNAAALEFYRKQYGIKRAVIPRVLSLAQVKRLVKDTAVEIEVFGFGSLCVMAEGRCLLSSYVTGDSPNTKGACSPAHAVEWVETEAHSETRLNGKLIERVNKGESAGYPVVCKGRFDVDGDVYHAIEEPTSLNTVELLPELLEAGVSAIKIEGRQRSKAYVDRVVDVWARAISELLANPESFNVKSEWMTKLASVSEGTQTTLGAYDRPWQ